MIRRLAASLRSDDDGFSVLFVASLLVLLLGMAAFAVDLGWIILNGSRLQRAADASALAGVIYLPQDLANVAAKAVDGADANGWDVGTVNGEPIGGGSDELDWSQLPDNKLQVRLTTKVDTFFLKALGFDEMTVSRESTAQYVKPVPLGSPANCIGIGEGVATDGLDGHATGVGGAFDRCNDFTQNFWSAINGRQTAKEHGDPYAVECGYRCQGTNPEYDPYYYFAIDVPAGAGAWVDVYLYDAGFYDRPALDETGDFAHLTDSATGGTDMNFTIFEPDATPGIPEDNTTPASCGLGTNPLSIASESSPAVYKNRWSRLCRIDNPTEGIYILRVANANSAIGGSNSYSVLADSDTFDPGYPTRVYSINEMGIHTNDDSGTATVYIAEVEPVHAGKKLELSFYDPGEGSGDASMTVLPPPGVSGFSCSWTATDNLPGPSGVATSGTSCSITTTKNSVPQFDGEWITMLIQLPTDYTCSSDCFWKMELDLNKAHDRTTWKGRVIGNPVALVPNP